LYNVADLFTATDTITIWEGELDAATVSAAGIPAVGYAGVDNWEPHFTRAVSDFARILVGADTDDKGQGIKAAESIAKQVGGTVVPMPDGEDANSFVVKHGTEALRELLNYGSHDSAT
jgi:DNA primase